MSVSIATKSRMSIATSAPVRVMIVDDAVVVRAQIKHWIDSEPDIEIVASLCSAREAIDQIESVNPDVVILDIEMPDLDGISALPLLLAKKPAVAIIIASTLTRRNAEIGVRALDLGALDCIPKPDATIVGSSNIFRHDLIIKVRELGLYSRRRSVELRSPHSLLDPSSDVRNTKFRDAATRALALPARPSVHALRPFPRVAPRVLMIGASTGGPQALTRLISCLDNVTERAPVLITQHMPPTFTMILAEHLERISGCTVREAEDGEPIVAGRVYVAPGGRHMRVTRRDGTAVIALDDGVPIHFCKPAVDPMFSSAARIWGSWVMGVILTGMGTDGTQGAADIIEAGGSIIAQDESTSVVWGMPGSAVENGLCSAVLPLDEIAPTIVDLFSGERS